MGKPIVTVVDTQLPPDRESELLSGYARLTEEEQPDGLVRSELLRGQDGAWRIQTTWQDLESLMKVRAAGKPPAALVLLDGIGAQHTHTWFTVEQDFRSP